MISANSPAMVPPRLLGGVAVMFWGAMSGHALVGLLVAVLLEGRSWVRTRWDFGEKGHVGAFQVSLVMVLLGMVLTWVDGAGQSSLLKMMQWAPVYALPIELAQRYGRQDSMFLNTFFYFSRRRMIQDRKEGREVDPMRVNTGYPYILLTVISASCSTPAYWLHAAGVVVILLACFVSVSVRRGVGWGGMVVAVPLLLLVAFGILEMIREVDRRLRGANPSEIYAGATGPMNETRTKLGNLGDLKQSREVMWRMWAGGRPEYLRMATYDVYRGGLWRYDFVSGGHESLDAAFEEDIAIRIGTVGAIREVFREEDQERAEIAGKDEAVRVRGTIDTESETALVPSVSGFYAVGKILGEDVNSETNALGSLRLVNRDVVIDYTMWAELGNPVQDSPPNGRDLVVPHRDLKMIRRIARKIGLDRLDSVEAKVGALRAYFGKEFTYSTHFETDLADERRSGLELFLTKYRKGHCEYFATAAALLLRESGVPARYCVGYAVNERKDDVWLMRGTDAHAWCRVFVDGQWQNVDLTPPDWREQDAAFSDLDAMERFKMWLKLLREDFQVWRQDEASKGQFWLVMGGIGLMVFGWIAFRLWRGRLTEAEGREKHYWDGEVRVTPLHRLEKEVRKVLGERPVGMPYGRWLEGLRGRVDGRDLARVIQLHQGMRFDPTANGGDQEMAELCRSLRSRLRSLRRGA